ncbi:MAG: cation transporter [Clostridia bacterium]|nr:cation transporter [Clostridia bacterium]
MKTKLKTKLKTKTRLLVAFILNLTFSVLEFVGGILTGSVAITSDAVHDFGDALSIGLSFFLEKLSDKAPDEKYTFGYARFSVLASLISCTILLVGSGLVIYHAINKIITPTPVNYDGMLIFAVVGLVVNGGAFFITHGGTSLNQRATSLHMLEDLLGWVLVLIGAVVIKFTGFILLDPILSLALALFIIFNACKTLFQCFSVFLEKKPRDICLKDLSTWLCAIDGVKDVHHLHVWSMDGQNNFATMHAVSDKDGYEIKTAIKKQLLNFNICHATIELENEMENCDEKNCSFHIERAHACCHHGHNHGNLHEKSNKEKHELIHDHEHTDNHGHNHTHGHEHSH